VLRNFLKVGYRHFRNEALYGVFHFLGLCIGLTGTIIAFIFVKSEFSFDKFHTNHEKIFRLTTIYKHLGQENRFAINAGYWDDVLVQDVPGVTSSTAFGATGSEFVLNDNNTFNEIGLYSDADFLKVFDFELLSGGRNFDDPNGIIITRNLANKVFGSDDVLGKIVSLKIADAITPLKVTGVLEDIPINSSIRFEYVVSGKLFGSWWEQQLSKTNSPGNTLRIYFRTDGKQDLAALQANVDRAFSKHVIKAPGYEHFTPVQALSQVHFNSYNQFELQPGANQNYMRIFLLIIFAFVFITVINGVNINSTRFLKRIKEVGIRKLLGVNKYVLVGQFVLSSVMTTLIATFFSIFCSYFFLTKVDLSLFSIDPDVLMQWNTIEVVLLSSAAYGIVTGLYPAIKMTSTATSQALKGMAFERRQKLFGARNSIVVIQIIATATMIAFSSIIVKQIHYLNNKELGYNKNNVIFFWKPQEISEENWRSFRDKLASNTIISSVGGSTGQLIGLNSTSVAQFSGNGSKIIASWNRVDADFLETMKMQITEGRSFSNELKEDSASIVISESARKAFGLETTLGTEVRSWMGEFKIIGVVNDFHFRPFDHKITPAVFILDRNPLRFYARYSPGKHREVIDLSQKLLRSILPKGTLSYGFFDDSFNAMMDKEHQSATILMFFTGMSLCITAIGLIGLIGYTVVEYRQEIAIRKVLGSTVTGILALIARRFLMLAGVGLLISIPAIVKLSEFWLYDFEYKTQLEFTDLFFIFVIILCFTFVIILKPIISSATENPVKVLRKD
jgi:putative ABC transport system permease protein